MCRQAKPAARLAAPSTASRWSTLGMQLFDDCDLEAVTTALLAIPGGTGSPLNPIAVF
jgi:hypothetical protein